MGGPGRTHRARRASGLVGGGRDQLSGGSSWMPATAPRRPARGPAALRLLPPCRTELRPRRTRRGASAASTSRSVVAAVCGAPAGRPRQPPRGPGCAAAGREQRALRRRRLRAPRGPRPRPRPATHSPRTTACSRRRSLSTPPPSWRTSPSPLRRRTRTARRRPPPAKATMAVSAPSRLCAGAILNKCMACVLAILYSFACQRVTSAHRIASQCSCADRRELSTKLRAFSSCRWILLI